MSDDSRPVEIAPNDRPILNTRPGVLPENAQFLLIPELGKTCYHEYGPIDGPPVILIHGLGWWSYMWLDHIAKFTANGYKVIVYDMLARGHSDAPAITYSAEPYLAQLLALVDHLQYQKVSILGFSMGGCLALLFASRYPDRVQKLVTMAPAGLPLEMPFLAKLITAPFIGYALFWMAGKKAMLARMRRDRFSLDIKHSAEDEELIEHMLSMQEWLVNEKEGFFNAFHSVLANFPLGSASEEIARIPSSVPLLVFWGDSDQTISPDNADALRELLPHAEVRMVADCGHALPLEPRSRDQVMTSAAQWLTEH